VLKIIHCITDCSAGGAERQLLRLIPELKKFGIDSDLWTLRSGGSLLSEFERLGVSVRPLAESHSQGVKIFYNAWKRIRHEKPLLIVAWMHPAFALLSFASGRAHPLIFNIRQNYEDLCQESFLSKLSYQFARFRLGRSSAVIVNAFPTFQVLKSQHPKVFFVPNGVFPLTTEPLSSRKQDATVFRVGLFARRHAMKGHRFLLEQMSALTEEGFCIEVVFAGMATQSDDAEWQNLLSQYRQKFSIKTLGELPEQETLSELKDLDLLVVPSLWGEGFSNIAVEAMLLSRPVLMSDIGSARVIQEQEYGIFRVGDAEQFRLKWKDIFSHRGDESFLQLESLRRRAETHFSLEKCAHTYAEIIKNVLKSSSALASKTLSV
jgi:glycosyltransferase involved in cell wall biosynthesis